MIYAPLYSTTLLVSFVMTLILFLYHSHYWNLATHMPLQFIYFLNMTSALMCIVWSFVDGRPELIPINYIANIIEFNCMGFCGYFWLRYCLNFVDMPALKTRFINFMILLPILSVMAMIITSPLTHWAFYIDEAGFFHRGTVYIMQQTGYLYLCVSSFLCLSYRKYSCTSSERRRLSVLAMFPLSPAIFGAVQILAPSGIAPTLQFSILISLILVFVDELDQKITIDSLTHLKNRYEFEHILQSKLHGAQKSKKQLYVFMSDLDDFKAINDTYGHLQGDEALKVVAHVLTQTTQKYDGICARMSGDEFVVLLEADSFETAAKFKSDLSDNIAASCSDLPYELQISIGVAEYDGTMSLMQLLDTADANMYEQKKLHRMSNNLNSAHAAKH